ncbi:NAD(P)/FAD-dependent oxidoreductase [Rhizobium laguerreae]|uniref:NAD(P)/FAD-dependent oxidoreductase n=1 Tax=Rhizobium laguerreae TaxID=1076926 RepID=UPI001442061F|nr:NAD(P)/FAD-dependent oxidoreductase [Rhizobium laguerreae]MBY3256333.1 NAD(P)/FAD-dependent oxidoreductase [Rhizobium laguerreae]MBY3270111.1 NAD(P)/FAD-dependent oxidoreductase [Rhizobium laguerreae]MBY3285250.1 NAD(P)/FAD-dependent oxidoreductase [Rhizobium laguerreae]MBY3291222.1 NAD(P)/FAD-dependent oxidoreductase [Rhizobium laguerreae]MBY3318417.1 NAD(P)/FAD-dependent oxidoreductase [Rhizobium laguerreae]
MSFEAIVIGGNFAGLSAAMQLVRARLRVLLVDAGAPRNRFSEASHGFLGQDGQTPAAIMQEGKRQLSLYPTIAIREGKVVRAHSDGDAFIVGTEDGGEERAARIVLATGVSDTLPEIPGLKERWGRSALHCPYCHGFEVGGGKLGVLANHPHSAHSAMMIPDWGATTFFTQALFEPDEEQLVKLTARGVGIERSPILELLGDNPKLEAVRLADGRVVPLDAVFVAPKTTMASPVAEQLGCAFDDGPFGPIIRVADNKETTVKGVFAAGDAASAMHNATLASASGVLAGVHCHQSLVMSSAA